MSSCPVSSKKVMAKPKVIVDQSMEDDIQDIKLEDFDAQEDTQVGASHGFTQRIYCSLNRFNNPTHT